jgi:probable rRNA maturation factor
VTVDWRSTVRRPGLSSERARRFLNRALATSGHSAGSVSVLFCGDRAMRRLNRNFRGKDRTTDVLSFPSGMPPETFLGDLVISIPEARRQARQAGRGSAGVLEKLLLHGLLHLLGYDHEADNGEMDALEARIRRRLRVSE